MTQAMNSPVADEAIPARKTAPAQQGLLRTRRAIPAYLLMRRAPVRTCPPPT
jgi:hypothetical protein